MGTEREPEPWRWRAPEQPPITQPPVTLAAPLCLSASVLVTCRGALDLGERSHCQGRLPGEARQRRKGHVQTEMGKATSACRSEVRKTPRVRICVRAHTARASAPRGSRSPWPRRMLLGGFLCPPGSGKCQAWGPTHARPRSFSASRYDRLGALLQLLSTKADRRELTGPQEAEAPGWRQVPPAPPWARRPGCAHLLTLPEALLSPRGLTERRVAMRISLPSGTPTECRCGAVQCTSGSRRAPPGRVLLGALICLGGTRTLQHRCRLVVSDDS